MELKNPVTLSAEALFRYRVVGSVEALMLLGRSLAEAVRTVASGSHPFDQKQRSVSERTAYRWVAAYRLGGIDGLEPRGRERIETSAVLSEKLVEFLCTERRLDRDASVPELVRRARELGIVRRHERVSRSTVWRTMRRMGLVTSRRKVVKRDSRRFHYSERMQMLITDFVHFRAGAERLRRIACYILCDATRFGLDVIVHAGTGERTETFLELLHRVLIHYGRMDAMYSDGGSAYASDDTARVMANLELAHIMGEARYPAAHGKIERFNQSTRNRILRGLASPEVDPDAGSLTLRLRHDLSEVYNNTPHEGLGGETPRQRWERSSRDLAPVPDEQWLRSRFTVTETRRVSNDHVVSYEGTGYEVPRGLAGERIELHRRVLSGALYILHEGRFIQLKPVDPEKNATSPRASKHAGTEKVSGSKTASAISFERRFGSVLDADGGCTHEEDEK
jgi:putative transposase